MGNTNKKYKDWAVYVAQIVPSFYASTFFCIQILFRLLLESCKLLWAADLDIFN